MEGDNNGAGGLFFRLPSQHRPSKTPILLEQASPRSLKIVELGAVGQVVVGKPDIPGGANFGTFPRGHPALLPMCENERGAGWMALKTKCCVLRCCNVWRMGRLS